MGLVLEAAWWGFVAGASLLLGAAVALAVRVPTRVVGLVMAFGAGVLVSAVSFELTEEAYRAAGGPAAAAGLLCGSAAFFAGDLLIDRAGGHRRKSPLHGGILRRGRVDGTRRVTATVATTGGLALVLGALLDGIPESAAIGVSLLDGQGVGLAMVAAVFLSNVPESMSATTGLRASGRSARWIIGLWAVVCLASTLASLAGYALLGDASAGTVAFIQTFAAGAILTMLADTMLPEAVEHAGPLVGVVTVLGFALAFFLGVA